VAVAPAGPVSVGRNTGGSTPGDGSPPQTSLSADYPAGRSARFALSADEPASFQCSLDGSPFTACASPQTYRGLKPGWHTFAVRATDRAGNTDATAAQLRWHATGKPAANQGQQGAD
jgi:hypothetical protein